MKLFGAYGFSDFGREVMPLLQTQVANDPKAESAYVDASGTGGIVNGHKFMTFEHFIDHPANTRAVTLAIGDGQIRNKPPIKD